MLTHAQREGDAHARGKHLCSHSSFVFGNVVPAGDEWFFAGTNFGWKLLALDLDLALPVVVDPALLHPMAYRRFSDPDKLRELAAGPEEINRLLRCHAR